MCVNRGHPWLMEAIDSVISQDDTDFQFLISANACSDQLWRELEESVRGDARVQLFRSQVGQLAFNLNLLVDNASGEYVVRMDSDDISERNRIRILRQAIARTRPDIIGSCVSIIDENGVLTGEMRLPLRHDQIVKALPTRTVFCHPSVAIRRQFLLEMRGYLGGLSSEDTDLWLRAYRAGGKVENLPDYLLRYRLHATQTIGSKLAYAEVAGHWLREFLIAPSMHSGKGLLVSLCKAIFSSWLPGARRYKAGRCVKNEHKET